MFEIYGSTAKTRMMAESDLQSNCLSQIHFYPLITVSQGCVCSLPVSQGFRISVFARMDMGREGGRGRAGVEEWRRIMRQKGDPGWNFNDTMDGTGERNPRATRSWFSFGKAY